MAAQTMRKGDESSLWTTGKMDRKHASSWRRRNRLATSALVGSSCATSRELEARKFDTCNWTGSNANSHIDDAVVLQRLQSCSDDVDCASPNDISSGSSCVLLRLGVYLLSVCAMLKNTVIIMCLGDGRTLPRGSWRRRVSGEYTSAAASMRSFGLSRFGLLMMIVMCCLAMLPHGAVGSPRAMSETLQRAYANSRGPSPGAKKLLNIPEDGVEAMSAKHIPLEGYEAELERDHALPTSMPNADILKTNSNPTYHKPRQPAHHGASILAGAAAPPSYAPPSRVLFTPPMPAGYRHPFSDKPTLRGTNAETGNYLNRRPIPPPSLVPGHERIPIRPGQESSSPQVPSPPIPGDPHQKKKALNTPSQKVYDLRSQGAISSPEQSNFTDYVPTSLNFPTISRILSGSNGRKEDIPEILLRTVTAKPVNAQNSDISRSDVDQKNQSTQSSGSRSTYKGLDKTNSDKDSSTEGSALPVMGPDMGNLDRPLIIDTNGESNTRRNLQFATNKNSDNDNDGNSMETGSKLNSDQNGATLTTFIQKDVESSTERLHNSATFNKDDNSPTKTKSGSSILQRHQGSGITWPIAWNLHIYLATVLFTILAVYSIFKIICYNKFTHLFTQYYFIILHLILVLVCLMRIFYMCYDPYNINNSLPIFLSEILLHVPEIFLSIAFAASILFLLINSINLKSSCYALVVRPRTIIIGGLMHMIFCIVLHMVENMNTVYKDLDNKIMGLICQVVYVVVCLSLGLIYLYVYKTLKKVLQKKSHSYIQGFQNLYQAIHINLATALLFILLAVLQIYGIFGINIQVNMTKFNWLQWGYQFSLRLIEISIVTLISWVISLKVSIGASLQHEKSDGHKISGLGLFPCTASSSNEQFESDYPTVCNTNTNLHTYTLRTGKPIYDAGVLAPHLQGPPDQCCSTGLEGQRFQLNTLGVTCDNNSIAENYSGRSSIANAAHSSSTESSNANSSQSASNHLMKNHHQGPPGHLQGYMDNISASDEHYSNCEPVIQSMDPSVTDVIDHEYNVIQYGNNSDFVRDANHKNNSAYGGNGGSVRGSQNFKHLSFDRLSSRNNSGHNLSNPRKKHRNKQVANQKNQQNCMTLAGGGYDANIRHYHHPHVNDANDFNYPSDNGSFHASGIQTLNPIRNYYDPSGVVAQGCRDSQRRGRNNSPTSSLINSSGSQKRGKNINNVFATAAAQDRPKSTDLYGFSENPNERTFTSAMGGQNQSRGAGFEHQNSYLNPEHASEADDRGGNSMLVAQDGFLRFRPLEDGQT
ncbi:uncharacterized protein LOC143912955 isoform X2 [Arctopsyche grandis]|uniref:uncharacterized protein LOC143912955 isoform X2 n=1 Tax=Arctopsyche grandis TaxID=121162 RepID=UPI00406D69A3